MNSHPRRSIRLPVAGRPSIAPVLVPRRIQRQTRQRMAFCRLARRQAAPLGGWLDRRRLALEGQLAQHEAVEFGSSEGLGQPLYETPSSASWIS
jgi:hypothetical protein